jgi:hypothetical protein
MDPIMPWLEARVRSALANQRGQAEVIVVALIIFLLWLLLTGRKVVVQ